MKAKANNEMVQTALIRCNASFHCFILIYYNLLKSLKAFFQTEPSLSPPTKSSADFGRRAMQTTRREGRTAQWTGLPHDIKIHSISTMAVEKKSELGEGCCSRWLGWLGWWKGDGVVVVWCDQAGRHGNAYKRWKSGR